MKIEEIEETVNFMDETYDANFGEWLRNEDNSRIVAHNLKKYVNKYTSHRFVTVLKFIVKDWTLRSIIILMKKIFDRGLCDRIEILQGLVYTWNSVFIAEFILSYMKGLNMQAKCRFVCAFFDGFETSKVRDILLHMEGKLDYKVKEVLQGYERKRTRSRTRCSIDSCTNLR
ncbi:hypothetical protein COBT_002797 [Conglomerata obtusa]